MEKATLIKKIEYAYGVLYRIQEMDQQKNSIQTQINFLAGRPSDGMIKRFFRFLGIFFVVCFIVGCISSLIPSIISDLGFGILSLPVDILYNLTGINMSFLVNNAVLLVCAFIAVKYIRYKRKKKEEQFAETDERIAVLQNEYWAVEQERQKFISENGHVINWIPQEYRNLGALSFIKKMLVDGRADTWKEAVNLYHEKKNRDEDRREREEDRRQQRMMYCLHEMGEERRHNDIKKALDMQNESLNHIKSGLGLRSSIT